MPETCTSEISYSGGNPQWASDYMHARYYSPHLARFLSVDPKRRYKPTKRPQKWNRYSYVVNNPLKYVDPNGEDLLLSYNFANSGLSQRQQAVLTRNVRAVFRNAGVRSVQTYFAGGAAPRALKSSDRVVEVAFTTENISKGSGTTYERAVGNKVTVSTHSSPGGESAGGNFLANVTAHGIAHGTGALPKYDYDAAPVGSLLNPVGNQAEPGSTMQTNVQPDVLGEETRDFSEEDAANLQGTLNDPQPE